MSGGLPDFDGPVTIMFTDIEGSTALRTTLGDAETDALFEKHDEIIRTEVEAHRGYDQKAALGDGFLAVFSSTRRAVACAVAIQRALETFNHSRAAQPLRVRIGLNTGEVAHHDGQLSGEAVHAASRVCGAADGGEVFVSDVTRQLAGTVPDVTFTDRGEFQLKGFPTPWKLWSLAWRPALPDTPHEVFVGREAELASLRRMLTSAIDGKGGLVLVGGEPGVGKTTLTKHLIKEAEARGAVALFGRCYETEGQVPYSPFVEMIEQALRVVPPEWMREDMGEDAAEVARMVPELRRRFPDIGEPLDLPPEQQRRYFFNAVAAFVTRAAARLPAVLVLDDVHWADEPTLLLIEHVAEQLREIRVLGVGTYRDVELDVSRPLAGSLERLLRARAAEKISLQRFDDAGVQRMLDALAGREVPPKLVDAIFSETEGNPFFVEEVFRHFVEEGKVFDDAGEFRTDVAVDELDVPESVRLVVGRRLERLGPDAHRALAAAAVIGRGFSFSLWESVAGIDAGSLLDVLDDAESAKVVVAEEREGDAHYTFAHELIRQTLLSSLTIPRRQRLHLAAADAIEQLDAHALEVRPSEVATHLLEAGVAADPKRTVEALTHAGDRAFEAAAFEDSGRFVESALELVDPSDVLLRTQLRERLAHTLRAQSRFEEAIDTMRAVIDAYAELGEAEAAGRLCFDAGYLLTFLARFEDTVSINQTGISLLGDRILPERANLLAGTGTVLSFAGFPEMGEESLGEAERIADQLGQAVQGRVAWLRCVQLQTVADFAGAIEAGRWAVDLLRAAGDLWTLADALGWLSSAFAAVSELEEGAAAARESLEIASRLGHVTAATIPTRMQVLIDQRRVGDLEAIEAAVRRDVELFEGSPFQAQSYTWLGVITQFRGRLDEALGYHDTACELERASAYAFARAFQTLNRAIAGARDECRSQLSERLESLTDPNEVHTAGRYHSLLAYTESAAMIGDEEIAGRLYPVLCGNLSEPVIVRFWDGATPARVAGMVAVTLGEWDEAEAHFENALAQIESIPNVLDAPQIRHRYGQMLVERGRPEDRDRALELIGSALDEYERLGMPVHAEWARELLKVHA